MLVSVANEALAADVATAIAAAINANVNIPVSATANLGTVTLDRKIPKVLPAIRLLSDRMSFPPTRIHPPPTWCNPWFVPTFPPAGAGEPDISETLEALGNVWYTTIACGYISATAYGELKATGDILADPIEKRMFISFMGSTVAYADYITLLGSFNSQWVSV